MPDPDCPLCTRLGRDLDGLFAQYQRIEPEAQLRAAGIGEREVQQHILGEVISWWVERSLTVTDGRLRTLLCAFSHALEEHRLRITDVIPGHQPTRPM